jgi:phosphohistidine phosphatase SixA
MTRLAFIIAVGFLLLASPQTRAADIDRTVAALRDGGYVIVLRHFATDDSQKDVYPFKYDDMSAQRQLSENGRETARALGAALRWLGIPIGVIYTSRLNRAVETGKLMTGRDVTALEVLSDSGAGSASAMANPEGRNAKAGAALRELVAAAPKPGTNNLVITHKTNIADAFGKEMSDIHEGEALVYKAGAPGAPPFARVAADTWIEKASALTESDPKR